MRVPFPALVAALLFLVGCAAPGVTSVQPPAGTAGAALNAVEALPADLGSFRRIGPAIDYERIPQGAGLGASVRYVPANGERMRATVYIYDRGRPRQPEGAGSPDVADELRIVAEEVSGMARIGQYRGIRGDAGMNVGSPSDPGSVRCVTFRVVQADGARTADAACVAVNGGRFLKVRLTAWNIAEPAAAGAIAAALLRQVEQARAGEATQPGLRT